MDELLAIGEFSARPGLSAKVLRSFAAAGLLVPAAVDPWTGYRYYAPGQLPEAGLILLLRRACRGRGGRWGRRKRRSWSGPGQPAAA